MSETTLRLSLFLGFYAASAFLAWCCLMLLRGRGVRQRSSPAVQPLSGPSPLGSPLAATVIVACQDLRDPVEIKETRDLQVRIPLSPERG